MPQSQVLRAEAQVAARCSGELSCRAAVSTGCPVRSPRLHNQLVSGEPAGCLGLAWQRFARTVKASGGEGSSGPSQPGPLRSCDHHTCLLNGACRSFLTSDPFHSCARWGLSFPPRGGAWALGAECLIQGPMAGSESATTHPGIASLYAFLPGLLRDSDGVPLRCGGPLSSTP